MENLTLEQQFNLRSFEDQVNRMSHDQAKEFCVKLYQQMLLKDNAYKSLIKRQWNLGE